MAVNAPDLFPGFRAGRIRTRDAELFARIGGNGPPLVLLHGYPQTHACWHRIAPVLARHFTLVLWDLPGYGESRVSGGEADESPYSKRGMARTLVAGLHELGLSRFSLAGHDRGGRAAYRLALDYPALVERLAVLSILPTFAMWARLQDPEYAMRAYRWFFLAQPAPVPEQLIAPAAIPYLHATLAEWTRQRSLSAFAAEALQSYEIAFASRASIAATCRDYRAGWTTDGRDDDADLAAGRKIGVPTLVLWGRAEFPEENEMLSAWGRLCADVRGGALDCGHFVAEEAADETGRALLEFFSPGGYRQAEAAAPGSR